MKKLLLIMRLSIFILLISVFQVSATGYSQANKLTLSLDNASLSEVFDNIESKSEFKFLYREDYLNLDKRININAKNLKVESILDDVLSNYDNLSYSILKDNLIVIAPSKFSIEITGKVIDEEGNPITGAAISIKGGTVGTITDMNGAYSIEATEGDILVFSFIGYQSKEIIVENQTNISVTLLLAIESLDQIVVVGYGTMRKSDQSGSSSTVNTEDYIDLPSIDISQSMQGKVAGVSILKNSGTPGGDLKIRIRGGNSMLGDNNPLVIVDGVAMNINLKDLNPNDIESMEILKDASSTAIYGSRGANGVIVINTKRGSSKQPIVEISSSYSVHQIAKTYDLLNAADYATLLNKMNNSNTFSPDEIAAFRTNGGTDWQDAIFQMGYTHNNQVSLLGGSEKLKYYLSGSYIDEEGILINTGQKKYSLRSNIDAEVNDKLSLSLNLSVSGNALKNTNDMAGSKESPIWSALIWSPTEPIYNADGTYNKTDQYGSIGFNPYMVANERVNDELGASVLGNVKINYKIIDNLTFSSILGVENNAIEYASFTNQFVGATTGSSRGYNNNFFWQASNLLTYKNTFDIHRISIMAGFEASAMTSKEFNASGSNLATESVGYDNLSLNSSQSISSSWQRWALRSYISRVSYSLKDRYLLTATYRNDGSSKFKGSNKFSSFPSFAAGWRISEEQFVKNLNIFDNLKLRGSWGITGNQAIRPYATLALLSTSVYSYGTGIAYTGYSPVGAENPDLKWEETTQINMGLDFAILDSRLTASADIFMKQTDGLLQATALPAYNGGGTIIKNIGSIENKGFEATLNYAIIKTNDLSWNTGFNFSSIKNKVISIGDEEQIFPGDNYAGGFVTSKLFVVKPGESLGSFYGYEFLGLWQTDEAAEAALYGNMPGDSKYRDINGDNIIDGDDLMIIGNALPKFSWGLNNFISYKNFDLNIMIEGIHGRDVLNLGYAAAGVAVGDARSITLDEAKNVWTESNTNTIWPKIDSGSNTDHINSSKWLQDGSFVKVRNISLAYSLSKEKAKFANFRFVLSAQNLLTFTKYKGFDPEVTATGNSDIDQGLDMGAYPSARSYTFGITLSF
ncbi:MAG: SusC/RagA family TonB-linked outer membrane protein [Bacteroidota bacterium]